MCDPVEAWCCTLTRAAGDALTLHVQESDWSKVEQLLAAAPHKVIPCFGVHPWCVCRGTEIRCMPVCF